MDKLRELQLVEKDCLDFFVKICEENNLEYILDFGTLLGAARHKGFIPWDDDVDLGMPREDYEKFTSACDIGLVSLDERFTVPNFPSKTTDYFKLSLPILASLDRCSAEDYGKFLEEEAKGGIFAEAGNVEDLYEKFLTLYNSKDLRKWLGNNGREYYEEHLGVDKAYKVIMNLIKEN